MSEVVEGVSSLQWHEAKVLNVAHARHANEKHFKGQFGPCENNGQEE